MKAPLVVLLAGLALSACAGNSETEPPTPPETQPALTAAADYVRFRGVPLHPSMTATPDDCTIDALFRLSGDEGWRQVSQNVLARDTQCFTTDTEEDALAAFFADALAADGWDAREVGTRDDKGIGFYARRKQGLEQAAIGSVQTGNVISGYTRYVVVAVLPEE